MSNETQPETVETEALVISDTRAMSQPREPEPAALVRTTPTSPMSMLGYAMEQQGTSIEQLRDLWGLQQEYEAHQAKKEFTRAMAAFKGDCPPVLAKDARVYFKSKAGVTDYRHATLGGILSVITPHLSRHGLSVSWEPSQAEKGFVEMTCVVTHEAGHSERRTMHGPRDNSGNKNPLQEVGSTATYLQRYTLTAALGLSTGELDDDGGGNNDKEEPKGQGQNQERPAAQQQRPPQERQEPAQQAEPLPAWVTKALAYGKTLGITKAHMEGSTGRGLAKPAAKWTEDEDKQKIKDIYKDAQIVAVDDRPAWVKDAFEREREPGQEG